MCLSGRKYAGVSFDGHAFDKYVWACRRSVLDIEKFRRFYNNGHEPGSSTEFMEKVTKRIMRNGRWNPQVKG